MALGWGILLICPAANATAQAGPAASPAEGAAAGGASVVLIGVPGLSWKDISATGTPNLRRLGDAGSIASLSVRTVGTWTCPMDGWLSVSAGTRAALPRVPCGQLPPDPVGSGGAWHQDLVPVAKKINMASNFRAAVGSLGDVVHQSGGCTAAVGPGASLVAADSGGRLDAYGPTPETFTDWSRCRVTVVDLENVVRPYLGLGVSPHRVAVVGAAARAAAVREADDEIGRVLAAIPQHTSVMVVGLSDQSDVPHLRVAMGSGPAFAKAHYLRSASTRRDGMTILPDVTATVLSAAALQVPAQVVGIPWTAGGSRGTLPDAAQRLDGLDVAAQTLRTSIQPFVIVFVICQLLVYGFAALALRGTPDTAAEKRDRRRRVLGVARILALVGAAIPVSTYLVNLLPWWKASQPTAAMFAGMLVWDLLLVAIALVGPWRRSIMIPGTILAGVTALVAATDLLRGSPLQLNSFMGYSPLVGGRYYGLSNIAFATFATGTLFFAAGLAHVLIRRGRRGWAVAVVILLGAGADALSGSPGLGAKFGGTIALFPGTAVTALIVAGKRVTPARVLFFAGLGIATIAAICYLDYRRPPGRRTHLGRFAQQVLDGQAQPVVTRKMLAMLHTVGNIPLTLLVAGGLLFLFFVLLRTGGHGGTGAGPLAVAYEHAPALRAGLTGTLVTSMSGFAVEDSGIAVPAIALTLAVPLAFAAAARARRITETFAVVASDGALPDAAAAGTSGAPALRSDPREPAESDAPTSTATQ
ncbi:MAG: hypothetical protein JWN52_7172 [Actinomycetia bacterium]|nr:hypothetical protein [Actinomycetes bacterium]